MAEIPPVPAKRLDEQGRCCGRKPIHYKRGNSYQSGPRYYCDRCDATFSVETGEQVPSWAYPLISDGLAYPRYQQ